MNLMYVVTQVDGPHSLTSLGHRGIFTNPEDAQLDLHEANQMEKNDTGWPHWKILVYDVKLKGVMEPK